MGISIGTVLRGSVQEQGGFLSQLWLFVTVIMPPRKSLFQRFRRLDAYAQNKILDEFRVKSTTGGLGNDDNQKLHTESIFLT